MVRDLLVPLFGNGGARADSPGPNGKIWAFQERLKSYHGIEDRWIVNSLLQNEALFERPRCAPPYTCLVASTSENGVMQALNYLACPLVICRSMDPPSTRSRLILSPNIQDPDCRILSSNSFCSCLTCMRLRSMNEKNYFLKHKQLPIMH